MSLRNAELAVLAGGNRGLRVHVLRYGSFFGEAPLTRFDNVANRFAMLAALGKPVTIYGEGAQRRPLISIADASAALRFVMRPDHSVPAIVNIAESCPSVLEIAEAVRRVRPDTEFHYTEQDILTHLSFEMHSRLLGAQGWRPTVGLEEGLGQLIARFGSVRAARLTRVQ
jgi:UDP-glucuronate decarboxylase